MEVAAGRLVLGGADALAALRPLFPPALLSLVALACRGCGDGVIFVGVRGSSNGYGGQIMPLQLMKG
jgi:hypothetical protein